MNRKYILRFGLALLVSVIISIALVCNASKNDKSHLVEGKSVALFDYFKYKGEDDFYISNPLPAENYFYNPILPGWYSDPSICKNDEGDYFLVTSTFTYFPGVPLFHSRDLVNWQQVGNVLNRASQLTCLENKGTSEGIFAPAIKYNKHNKTYYMITTNVGVGNFIVKTQDPFGDWSDPIMLPSISGIDPSLFFDDNGKAYIVNSDDAPDNDPDYLGHRTIRIQEYNIDTDETIGARKIIVNKGGRPEENPFWLERPHLYKINGKYLLMISEGGTAGWNSEIVFSSDSPMGVYRPWDNNPILTQRYLDAERPNPITSAGHADLIQAEDGQWWAYFLACRPINNQFENLGRETFLMPVKWSEDGFPYLTRDDEQVPRVMKRENVKRKKEVTFGNFEKNDMFDGAVLDHYWMSLRAPAGELYSLTDPSGYLSLKCVDIYSTEKRTPAYICRRLQHHKFECSTRMIFNPADNEEAGMLLYKDEAHQYFFYVSKKEQEKTVGLRRIGKNQSKNLASNTLKMNEYEVDLRIVSRGTHLDFYYALPKGEWQLLCKNIDASYLSTANAGGFTGTTVGMYATKNNESMDHNHLTRNEADN